VRGYGDLRLLAWGAPVCAVAALLLPWEATSLLFAAPLALLMPGYAIASAAFAGRSLEWPRFTLLALALSLAVLALGALPLNYVPGGIRGSSWALLLVAIVLVAARVAALRRGGDPTVREWPRPQLSGVDLALLGAALVTVAGALVLAQATLPAKDAFGYTELWIVPVTGSERSEARIGVKSQEQEATDFDLRIRIGGDRVIRRSFPLRPGEEQVVRIGPPAVGTRVPVIVTLLRHEEPFDIYRRVKGYLVSPREARR